MNFSKELLQLARLGDTEKLQSLLSLLAKGDWINTAEEDGTTALHAAVESVNQAVVAMLVNRGADVNSRDEAKNTPLHLAAQKGDQGIVELLLSRGADANSCNFWGTTPLHVATEQGHLKIVEILLNEGAKVNSAELFGNTPLHIAASKGYNKVIVNLLLQAGADPNAVGTADDTPLHEAAAFSASINGYTEVIRPLLRKGASMYIRNKDGNTPLCRAALGGQILPIQQLLQHGAYSDSKTHQALSRLGKKELFGLNIARDIAFYTTLLLAGANLTGKIFPDKLREKQHYIESTVIEWLSPLHLTAAQCRTLTPHVLRALPRLLYWIDQAEYSHDKEKDALKEQYATVEAHVQGLKHFFWIPNDETGARASVIQGLQAKAVPTEIFLLIREKLVVPVLTELLVKLYPLPFVVARYLVKESRARPEVYADFTLELFRHDWQTPCPSPTTGGALYVNTYSPLK